MKTKREVYKCDICGEIQIDMSKCVMCDRDICAACRSGVYIASTDWDSTGRFKYLFPICESCLNNKSLLKKEIRDALKY